ncbi:pyrimidine-specific ribonucleoside hydrolase [Actinocorallia herbida]|uniref:Pyrimidine-specific ribonucleoside hydrolase n=1 Tax=Actinocorallia herbida TaxID=58109 RepID=A0A3N1CTQ2_9ACTN|nr:nucleoside hydrolase [Actinocorallia herbida]ROO84683.1 pyrimidine-specific ribonucleoside hydrolase [Actinocorallia herbida]
MLDVLLDIETQDPDDVLALCLLAGHPRARLRAVTVTPGSADQIGLVRRVLALLGRADVPVGGRDPGTGRDHVSGFHRRWLGSWSPADPDAPAVDLLAGTLTAHPRAVLVTGGPPHHLGALLEERPDVRLDRWVAQGGFAGDPLVPPADRLPKFAGKDVCPTFNFNGAPRAALLALSPEAPIGRRELVSKNVTHGVRYDRAFHERLAAHKAASPSLALIHRGMDLYLRRRRDGKLLHDPTAACCALAPAIAAWAEAEVRREPGGWGGRPAEHTRTFLTTSLDHEAFFRVFTGQD